METPLSPNRFLIPTTQKTATGSLSAVEAELHLQAESPPHNDNRIAAFSEAFLERFDHPVLQENIPEMYSLRGGMKSSYAVNILLRSFQRQLLREAGRYDYPYAFDAVATWGKAISRILNDAAATEEFTIDTLTRDGQANVDERYKSFKLLLLATADRRDEPPRILDIGCSQNHGLKKLAIQQPFREVEVFNRIDNKRSEDQPGDEVNAELSQKVNALLAAKLAVGHSVGVDMWLKDDWHVVEWAKSCSFYPSELLDEEEVRRWEAINKRRVDGVGFVEANFAKPDGPMIGDALEEEAYDAVTFSTVLFQSSPEDRRIMRDRARQFVKPDGILVYQDFAHKARGNPRGLSFYDHWFSHPYRYRTFVEDMAEPDGPVREVFRWENGRCQKLWLNLGRLSSRGEVTNSLKKLIADQEVDGADSLADTKPE